MRVSNVWVNSDDNLTTQKSKTDEEYTYIMPKNLLKKFVTIGDLKVKIFGYLYGKTVEGMIR